MLPWEIKIKKGKVDALMTREVGGWSKEIKRKEWPSCLVASFIRHVSLDILRYEYVFNFGQVYIPTSLVELATE